MLMGLARVRMCTALYQSGANMVAATALPFILVLQITVVPAPTNQTRTERPSVDSRILKGPALIQGISIVIYSNSWLAIKRGVTQVSIAPVRPVRPLVYHLLGPWQGITHL